MLGPSYTPLAGRLALGYRSMSISSGRLGRHGAGPRSAPRELARSGAFIGPIPPEAMQTDHTQTARSLATGARGPLRVCVVSAGDEAWASAWWAANAGRWWPGEPPLVRWASVELVLSCPATLERLRRDDVVCVVALGPASDPAGDGAAREPRSIEAFCTDAPSPEAEPPLKRALQTLGEHACAGVCCLNEGSLHLANAARFAGLLTHVVDEPEAAAGPDTHEGSSGGALLAGMLVGVAQRQQHVRDVEVELHARRAAQSHVNTFVSKVDGELLLAAKLQRETMRTDDFRPPNLGFAVVYRPAWFVSGDVYKLTRLDEAHVGLLLADAMGHGVSAAMYSMLIASSATMKDVGPGGYRLIPPSEAMSRLNASLVQPESESTRFASAIAATLNLSTGALSVCNAGHPTALVVGERVRRLESTGPVLGVLEDAVFELASADVGPGETVVLYTDGLEAALSTPAHSATEREVEAFLVEHIRASKADPRTMATRIERALDALPGSLAPQDDVTIIIATRSA